VQVNVETARGQIAGLNQRSRLVLGDFLGRTVLQRALLRLGNFSISKSWKGSSRHLKPFWAKISVYRAERAHPLFSVIAVWRPSNMRSQPPGAPSRIVDQGLFWTISWIGYAIFSTLKSSRHLDTYYSDSEKYSSD